MNEKTIRKVVRYFHDTWENKVMAALLNGCGIILAKVTEDATALFWLGIIAVPMFFSRKRWVY